MLLHFCTLTRALEGSPAATRLLTPGQAEQPPLAARQPERRLLSRLFTAPSKAGVDLALIGDSLHVGSLAALRARTAGLCAGIAAATLSMIDIGMDSAPVPARRPCVAAT